MSQLAKTFWEEILPTYLERRKGVVIRKSQDFPGLYYATGVIHKDITWACRRISDRIGLPPEHQLSEEDYSEVLDNLGLTIPNSEIWDQLDTKNIPVTERTGYSAGPPEMIAKLRLGTSHFLRCTTKSVKLFRQAAMKDTVLGEASLAGYSGQTDPPIPVSSDPLIPEL